ncbi:hypothetical protein GALMADRAFT_887002 [Galerina marginata CBS 339.88]|uniref:Uncharacterized protein n=1 Tax=Galerina marginata (strain CBS 339.88) TaxID=685588 RepID=A0A067SGS6_GALM3|nr:hypothetical protein GALMADRAFT_887002 [Galerina marginata CBS 339.88]
MDTYRQQPSYTFIDALVTDLRFLEYRNLVGQFLRNPLRAGKYVVDNEKFAIFSMILLETLTGPELPLIGQANEMFCSLYKAILRAGPFEDLIALMNIPEIRFPHDVGSGWRDVSGEMCEKIVQVFGKYLERVCGSVPLGFRITFEGNDRRRQESYYYDADRQVSYDYDPDDWKDEVPDDE